MQVEIYETARDSRPFIDWLYSLKDLRTQARIEARVRRLSLGQWGDHKPVGKGVIELRLYFGPGYRIYCGRSGITIIVLLLGGDKGSQKADIETAKRYLSDYKERS